MKHLFFILILFGLLHLNNFSYAQDRSIEHCADKWYNDDRYLANETTKIALQIHRYQAERYSDWKRVAKLERDIVEYRKEIPIMNNEMLSLLSTSLDEKQSKSRFYYFGVEACKKKRDKDKKEFEQLWDGPVEIRELIDDDDSIWYN